MMDDLQRKHRQEQRDLQSRVTQKKKSASKKTRKGVNDECSELERRLRERQAGEIAQMDSQEHASESVSDDFDAHRRDNEPSTTRVNDVQESITDLSIASTHGDSGNIKKPNRQKARLARRAAEQESSAEKARKEASELPNLREREKQSMREAYTEKGLKEHEIRSDGHCLYAAIADQLTSSGVGLKTSFDINESEAKFPAYIVTRNVAATYISQNADIFMSFLEEPLDEYVRTIRETGEWGGHLELLALAKAYASDIHVLHGDGHVDEIESGASSGNEPLWLAYYRHSYGLGEHYNSLRRLN